MNVLAKEELAALSSREKIQKCRLTLYEECFVFNHHIQTENAHRTNSIVGEEKMGRA